MIHVHGQINPVLLPLSYREMAACLAHMCEKADCKPGAVLELECMHDAAIAALNVLYMGAVGPTNILSFPAGDSDFLGSLALSVDCMHREAFVYGQDRSGYCCQLLAHGLAHLLGYEHGQSMDALCAQMLAGPSFALEEEGCA